MTHFKKNENLYFKEVRNNYDFVKLSDIVYIKAEKGRTFINCNTMEIKSTKLSFFRNLLLLVTLTFTSCTKFETFFRSFSDRDIKSETKEFLSHYYKTLENKDVNKFDDFYEPVLSQWFTESNVILDNVKSESRDYFKEWPVSKHVIYFNTLKCKLNENGTIKVNYNLDYYCSKQGAKDSLQFNIDIKLLLSESMKIISIQDDIITRTKKEYFSNDWSKLKTSKNASYYRVLTLDKDKQPVGLVKNFYITGELQFTGILVSKSMRVDSLNIWNGELKWYHKNGLLSEIKFVVDSLFEGLTHNWDENGVLLYTLKYQKGIPIERSEFEFYENGNLKIMSVVDNEYRELSEYKIYCDETGKCEQKFSELFSYNQSTLDWRYSDWNITNNAMYYSRKSKNRLNYLSLPYNQGAFQLSTFMTPKFNKNNVSFGFIFGFEDFDNYGAFIINNNTFSITHFKDGFRTRHADEVEDKSLSNLWNDYYDKKLMIQKKDDNIIFAINAKKVFSIEGDFSMGNGFGYYIGSEEDSTLIAFDNFEFTQPTDYPLRFDTINNVNLLK